MAYPTAREYRGRCPSPLPPIPTRHTTPPTFPRGSPIPYNNTSRTSPQHLPPSHAAGTSTLQSKPVRIVNRNTGDGCARFRSRGAGSRGGMKRRLGGMQVLRRLWRVRRAFRGIRIFLRWMEASWSFCRVWRRVRRRIEHARIM